MGKKESVVNELSRFKKALSRKLPLEKMILFGSYARGDYKKDSDVDLMLVSSKFAKRRFTQRTN